MATGNGHFRARPIFTIHAEKMATNVLLHSGPMGVRTMASAKGGTVVGSALNGTLLPGLVSEWQLESAVQPGIAWVDGLISVLPDEGEAILIKYIGRRSPRYGPDGWRIAITFDAPADGSHDWLNDAVAVGQVEIIGEDLRFEIFELLRGQGGPDESALPTEPLCNMVATSSVGDRHVINSPISSRYLTHVEGGFRLTGRLEAEWPIGFAWGAHRVSQSADSHHLPMHIDMRPGLRSANAEALIQHYIGATSRAVMDSSPDADRSWLSVATYEAPAQGELAYLNEVLALGVGWVEDNEAHYEYRIWA